MVHRRMPLFHAITLLPGQPCTKVNVSAGLKMKCLLNRNKKKKLFNSIDDPQEKRKKRPECNYKKTSSRAGV